MLEINTYWFLGTGLFTVATAAAGVFAGRGTAGLVRASVVAAVGWMLGWAWLIHHPDAALEIFPVTFLSRVEGFGGVPAFMFLLGVLWSQTHLGRQRVLVAWAAAFGGIYFVNGGLWLLQDTPTAVMGHTQAPAGVVVRQTQDYSCVPAACATALNLLGQPSTEAEMAGLTDTRPGTGATVLRALQGLNTRLEDSPLRARLVALTVNDLHAIPLPALTPLQYEHTRRHMVVILAREPGVFWLMDPMSGLDQLDDAAFESLFVGQVIVFDGPRPAADDGPLKAVAAVQR